MTRKEKEVIKRLEIEIIETVGKTSKDENRLCTIIDALFALRRGYLDSAEKNIALLTKKLT